MTPSQLHRPRAALMVALAASACSSAPRETVQPVRDAQGPAAAVARARADSIRHPYTAADIFFMTHMIGHHAQAIVMAGWADSHGASPSVRTLAHRIINAQHDEIAFMQLWLRNRQLPVPGTDGMSLAMPMSGAQDDTLMPGMLTADQMQRLDQARGTDFDRFFLTFMLQHHRGAVSMVQTLFGAEGAGQDETVFKLASDINVDQGTEIARMERMLITLQIVGSL